MQDKTTIKDISFRDILGKLHANAVKAIEKIGTRFLFQDTAFVGGRFTGPGQHTIMVILDSADARESLKGRCLSIILTYLKTLTGTDFSEQLKRDHLSDISRNDVKKPQDEDGEKGEIVQERLFMGRRDRILSENLDRIFENDAEEKIVVGWGVNYTFQVPSQGEENFKDVLRRNANGMFGGKVRLQDIGMTSMGGASMLEPEQFRSVVTVNSSGIFTNLHAAAVNAAARKIGVKTSPQINQFIINTGMTDDGEHVANQADRMNPETRFPPQEELEVGIVMENREVQTADGDDEKKRDAAHENSQAIQGMRRSIAEGISEYMRQFCGDGDVDEEGLVEFIPVYGNGKVKIRDGAIVDSEDHAQTKDQFTKSFQGRDNGKAKGLRLGYKTGYRIMYGE